MQGQIIKELRLKCDMTLEEVASELDCTVPNVYQMELREQLRNESIIRFYKMFSKIKGVKKHSQFKALEINYNLIN